MHLRQILAAADDSEEGRAAILTAARVARAAGAALTVLNVAEATAMVPTGPGRFDALRRLTASVLSQLPDPPAVDHAIVSGLPGIEICRFAEENGADLIVMGRKHRTERQRLLIGDTADSVARRSPLPSLFVPAGPRDCHRLLAALDGTERGHVVLLAAAEFTRQVSGRLRAVTVEPPIENEIGVTRLPTGRSARLAESIGALRQSIDLGSGSWDRPARGGREALVIHRGGVVAEVLREIESSEADVLVVGYRRGGPAGTIEAGSVARRLIHESPCTVLTIPI